MKALLLNSLRLLYRKHVPQPQSSIKILKNKFLNSQKNSPVITSSRIKKFNFYLKLRSLHYPIQYICQVWPFRDLQLKLRKPILIPRFQSQYMIQVLIEKIKQKYTNQQIKLINFVEYGCGSGALGLSLIKQLNISGTLIDINNKCTILTQINKKLNKISSNKAKILTADMQTQLELIKTHNIIISNPPYLSEKHYQKYLKPQIKKYQDKNALVTQNDGLFYINLLTNQWKNNMMNDKLNNRKCIMMLEFDGRIFEGNQEWLNQFVIMDQYGKRRFILLEN